MLNLLNEFSKWTGDIEVVTDIATLTMNADKEVTAIFIPRTFNVEVSSFGRGSVLGIPEEGYATFNDTIELQAIAEGGATFVGWSGDKISQDPVLGFQVGRDLQITALFVQTIQTWLEDTFSALKTLEFKNNERKINK